jgi:hypothetical protein
LNKFVVVQDGEQSLNIGILVLQLNSNCMVTVELGRFPLLCGGNICGNSTGMSSVQHVLRDGCTCVDCSPPAPRPSHRGRVGLGLQHLLFSHAALIQTQLWYILLTSGTDTSVTPMAILGQSRKL